MKRILIIPTITLGLSLSGCSKETISKDKAKQIALNNANVEEKSVTFTIQNKADDKYYYFFENNEYTYEYEINIFDGSIENKEILAKNYLKSKKSKELINSTKAKEIALAHFNFSADQITNFECEIKENDSIKYYAIKFDKDNYHYLIEIDAISGDIKNTENELIK